MSKKASKFHVTESDFLCKNRCGFYGNTAWKGYCSVCYKSLSTQKPHKTQVHHGAGRKNTSPRTVNSEQNFAHFEEKRRQQSDRFSGPMRSFFSKSSKKDKVESNSSSRTSLSKQG